MCVQLKKLECNSSKHIGFDTNHLGYDIIADIDGHEDFTNEFLQAIERESLMRGSIFLNVEERSDRLRAILRANIGRFNSHKLVQRINAKLIHELWYIFWPFSLRKSLCDQIHNVLKAENIPHWQEFRNAAFVPTL